MRTQEAPEHRRPTMDGSRAEGEGSGTEAAGTATPESQWSGSPWSTDSVTSWVSPNLKKSKEEKR